MADLQIMEKIKKWFAQQKWRQWKKGDWIILVLAGILLLVIALPTGTKKTVTSSETEQEEAAVAALDNQSSSTQDEYVDDLESRLEDALEEMDGVGKVKVMITLADQGESVVEKDVTGTSNTTTESDSDGGSRTVTESETGETTVYVETGEEKYPYVTKEELPAIEGVMVVAEGAESKTVVADISEVVESLFAVEPHKIVVVKMRMQEESN